MTQDVPPGEMRASDAEREQTAGALQQALSDGRLDIDEFQERLDGAYRARTRGELQSLVRDLPEAAGTPAGGSAAVLHRTSEGAAATGRREDWAARIGGQPTSRWGLAALGGYRRRGSWTVPRVFTSITVLGGGELDLRAAQFEGPEVSIRVFALLGGVTLIVPPEAELEGRDFGIISTFEGPATAAPQVPRVTVTVTVFALCGGVTAKRRPVRADHQRQYEGGTLHHPGPRGRS